MFHFAQDSWLSKFHTSDKLYHLFGSAVLFAFLWFPIFLVMNGSELTVAMWAFIGGLIVEIFDGFGKEGFSWKDLVADFVGIMAMWFWIRLMVTIAMGLNLITF